MEDKKSEKALFRQAEKTAGAGFAPQFEGRGLYGAANLSEAGIPENNGQVYTITNETGEGRIRVYPVFTGIELIYNEMRLTCCCKEQESGKNVIEINYCAAGRYECSFSGNGCCYLSPGDIAVSAAPRRKTDSCFPLGRYEGITLLVNTDRLLPEMLRLMEQLGINMERIRRKITEENRCLVLRAGEGGEEVFSQLYRWKSGCEPGLMRLKALEILLFISGQEMESVQPYLSREKASAAKRAAQLLTRDPARRRTIRELAGETGVSPTVLKESFKEVYGTPVYAYLRGYRMTLAQKLLRQGLSVAETAARVGYENPNKFSAAFKAHCGVTPTAFKKAALETPFPKE